MRPQELSAAEIDSLHEIAVGTAAARTETLKRPTAVLDVEGRRVLGDRGAGEQRARPQRLTA